MSDQTLQGRAAIVTGSGRNIGRSIALTLAQRGAAVVVNGSQNRAAVDRVVAEIETGGGRAIGVMADVSQDSSAAPLVDAAVQAFGSIDIVVSTSPSAAIAPSSTYRRRNGTRCCAPTSPPRSILRATPYRICARASGDASS